MQKTSPKSRYKSRYKRSADNDNSDIVFSYSSKIISSSTITGGHSKQDHIWLVKIGKYVGFCMYRRSYLIWSPAIARVFTSNDFMNELMSSRLFPPPPPIRSCIKSLIFIAQRAHIYFCSYFFIDFFVTITLSHTYVCMNVCKAPAVVGKSTDIPGIPARNLYIRAHLNGERYLGVTF